MASREDIQRALVNADKAGDTAAAQKLARALQSMGHSEWDSGAPLPEIGKPQGSIAGGIGEAALSMGTGMAATPAAGLAGMGQGAYNLGAEVMGAKPGMPAADRVRQVQGALTYEPRTQAGQTATDIANKPMELLDKGAGWASDKTFEATGSPALATSVKTALEFAPAAMLKKVPGAAGEAAAGIAERGEKANALNAPRTQTINALRTAGIKIAPSEYGGSVGSALQSMAGKAKVERQTAFDNSDRVNHLARIDIGMKDDVPLTPDNLEIVRDEQHRAYENLVPLGRFEATPYYSQELFNADKKYRDIAIDFPKAARPNLEAVKGQYAETHFTARGAIDAIIDLRHQASKNLKNYDPKVNAEGYVQRNIAAALENELERQAEKFGSPALVQDFRDARRVIAKTIDIEDSINTATGDLSASSMAKISKNGKLDGNLKLIADGYKVAPKSMQGRGYGKEGPFSAIDFLVGAAGWAQNPSLAAAVVARPAISMGLRSKAYQKSFAKVPEYKRGHISKSIEKVGKHPLSGDALGVGALATEGEDNEQE